MSLLSTPLIADALARLFARAVTPRPRVRLPEIAVPTTTVGIPTRHGDVEATIYRPATAIGAPVYVNVHGGGFVVGHREQDDPWCRYLADRAGVTVVNVDYVLAPHRRFPAPVEQVHDVLRWAADDGRDWDGARLCVGGQSAGGNLAAGAARLALRSGGPAIALQVVHYAPLDLVTATADKPSPLGDGAVMKPWMGAIFDTAYVPNPARRRDPLVSPAWSGDAEDLSGIAPALIVTAEYDRLRDEARRYAERLDAVGALVEYLEVPGVDHGYNIMSDAPDAETVTRDVYARIAAHVTRATA
ncbi:alpha/beta hydrolase [Mycolicibacterium grossiae]|uniref:Carboxylesterase n=1 Tax=Mycolicibacterium grossiae TaxID=1552759 RepID=A0A1E8QBS8_9MYCO|nr:alpha/beta hydrolase [Mycolicibacterium grossiae]OFJ55399.1 carboxylesterase [Mycolicibacterium grossiae]QEM46992.1 alpha/beta hydrolase [Mycolicibacterium grossiae]